MDKILLRPVEVAEVTGLGKSKVYELLARGEMPSIRIDGSVRIPVDQLRDWITRKAVASVAESEPANAA